MGQILDQAIRIYRRNFLRFVGIVAAVQVPMVLLQLAMSYLTVRGTYSGTDLLYGRYYGLGYFLGLLGTLLTSVFSIVLLWGIAAGAISRAVAGLYLGEPITFAGAFRRIAPYVPRLIGAILFALVLSIGAFIWTLIPCIGWLSGPGLLMLFFTAIVPLIAPAVVIERKTALNAVLRAWHLIRRRFWWVTGLVLILYLFNLLVVSGPGAIVTLILQVGSDQLFGLASYTTGFLLQTVLQSLASLILSLIYLPLQLTCTVLMYLDLRVRTEGLDLALQTAWALPDETAPAQALPSETAPARALAYAPPPSGGLITWKEIGYFALISLGALALIGLIYGALIAIFLLALGPI
jgi:hypothetical protein